MGIGKGGGGATYKHLDFLRSVKEDTSPLRFPFKSASTMLVDEVNVFCKNFGIRDIPYYASIIDAKSNKQIGRKIAFNASLVDITPILVTGLKASLIKGRNYFLEYGVMPDNFSNLTTPPTRTIVYSSDFKVFGYSVSDPVWRIKTGTGYTSIGGWQSYKGQGHFTRSFDVGTLAQNLKSDGTFIYSDIIPALTEMTIDLYYTDDALVFLEKELTNWKFFDSNVKDGATIPKHRYWRAFVQMKSNKTRDETPELADMTIQYRSLPKTFGTVIETVKEVKSGFFIKNTMPMVASSAMRVVKRGSKNLSSFNINASKVNPKFQVSIGGGFNAVIAEDKYSNRVFNKNLNVRDCRIRVGYRSVNSTIELYKARVSDVSYKKGSFSLSAKDSSDLFNIKIPSSKAAPTWDASFSYTAGEQSVFFGALYTALLNNTNSQPDLNPLDWNQVGGAWNDIVYDSNTSANGLGWHLADILEDIIKNKINVHSSLVDFGSIQFVKSLLPSRIGEMFIRKPTDAKKLINEISWLLESHIVIKNNKVTLIKEPSVKDANFINFERSDILENSLTFKAGWSNVVNECVIITAYDYSSDENTSNFNDGEVVVDATSVQEYNNVSSEVFKDKFNLPSKELQDRAATFVNKWKNGRGIVKFKAPINKFEVDIMDLVSIQSKQLPEFTNFNFSGIVISKDINWLKQEVIFTLLEVK